MTEEQAREELLKLLTQPIEASDDYARAADDIATELDLSIAGRTVAAHRLKRLQQEVFDAAVVETSNRWLEWIKMRGE